jgi:ankyrin repeat protein
MTALMLACQNNKIESIKELLEHAPQINFSLKTKKDKGIHDYISNVSDPNIQALLRSKLPA